MNAITHNFRLPHDGKPNAASSRRFGTRSPSPALKVAVVRNKLMGRSALLFCNLADVSQGGVSITSEWFEAKLGDKLNLQFFHGAISYLSRCVVTRVAAHHRGYHYGLAFISAPIELDRLIDIFVQSIDLDDCIATKQRPSERRKCGLRMVADDAQVYVREAESARQFALCQVANFSRGGMGFYCLEKIGSTAPFEIVAKISQSPNTPVLTGHVLHQWQRADRYYYCMAYRQVPEELNSLIHQLEQHAVSPITV